MKGLAYLSWRHLVFHKGQSAVLVLCLALTILLPAGTHFLVGDYERALLARAADTPLVAGAKGNRFDLTLAALYFRESSLEPIPYGELEKLEQQGVGLVVPLNVRSSARGFPIVGTGPEYYELRALTVARGTPPLLIGDAALGSEVAVALGLGPGDTLFSDPRELYDIAKPASLELTVTSVLAPRGTPDDGAVFVDTKTAWILEGLLHGHGDAEAEVDQALVLQRKGDNVMLSPALIEHNRITAANLSSFHFHGSQDAFPLTALLVFPEGAKAGTLAKSRMNAEGTYQMLVPRDVVEDLVGFVFRVKAFLDSFSGVLALTTALLSGLVIVLATRLRAGEIETLHRMGCSRSAVARLLAIEALLLVLASAVLSAAGVGAARLLLPDLVGLLT